MISIIDICQTQNCVRDKLNSYRHSKVTDNVNYREAINASCTMIDYDYDTVVLNEY